MIPETRVGYVSMAILREYTQDYITKHTDDNGMYHGGLEWLIKYDKLDRALRQELRKDENRPV